jgi:hypothetical protein
MADRYWVGGTGAWNDTNTTNWSASSGGAGGASVPTSADNVFFNGSSGGGTVTINTVPANANSVNFTGYLGSFAGSVAQTLNVAGSFTLNLNTNFTFTGNLTFTGTGTLTSSGKTLSCKIFISTPGGTVTLGDALTMGTNIALTVTEGTFSTSASNYAVTVFFFNITGSASKTVSLNGSTVSVNYGASTTPEAFSYTGSNLTFNAGTSTVSIGGTSGALNGGTGLTFNNVSFPNLNITNAFKRGIYGANTFAQLSLTAPLGGMIRMLIGANQTITTLICSGASQYQRLCLESDVPGTARTLTVGTYSTIANVDFRDITAAGASSPWSGTSLGDCGGNSNITFPAPKTVYLVSASTAQWGGFDWSTSSGGSTSAANFPLAQDTAILDNNSAGVGSTIQIAASYNIGAVTLASRTNAATFNGPTSWISCYGSFTLSSALTSLGGFTLLEFAQRGGTQDITSAGETFAANSVIYLNNFGGTIRLVDAFATAGTGSSIRHLNGTLNLNGNTATTNNYVVDSGGAKNITFNGGTLTLTGSGFTTPSPTGFTTTAGTGTGYISLTSTSIKSFSGSTVTYNCVINQGGAGRLDLTGGAWSALDLQNSYAATGAATIRFQTADTTTFTDFTASGVASRLLTLDSNSAGTRATISKSSGTVSVSFCSIKDTNATGGATWNAFALNGNINGGNNLGWDFGVTTGGSFIAFFM